MGWALPYTSLALNCQLRGPYQHHGRARAPPPPPTVVQSIRVIGGTTRIWPPKTPPPSEARLSPASAPCTWQREDGAHLTRGSAFLFSATVSRHSGRKRGTKLQIRGTSTLWWSLSRQLPSHLKMRPPQHGRGGEVVPVGSLDLDAASCAVSSVNRT